jgi:glycosyltransferase involved in cell wall biosynthesis
MNPMVSVILPYYRGQRWLHRSVQSVLMQKGVPWELIIVDDGSEQSPASLIEPLQDERIRLLHRLHAGKGMALNSGAKEAKTDILCFIDQDDIMNPGRLQRQVEILASEPEVDVVYSDYERIHDDGEKIDIFTSHQASNDECLLEMSKGRGLLAMQTIMLRKNTFWKIGGFSDDMHLTGLDDAEFLTRVIASNAVLRYVPGIVQKWVEHGDNYSKSAEFQKARLTLLEHLSQLSVKYPAIQKSLPHFRYHAFYMRGLYFLETRQANRAVKEFLRAIRSCPFHWEGYYMLINSITKHCIWKFKSNG